jgi:hypothetical protein
MAWKVIGWIFVAILFVIFAVFFFGFFLPGWNKVGGGRFP